MLILIVGVEGASTNETVNLLNERIDPRLIATCAFSNPPTRNANARRRRYWRALPAKDTVSMFFGASHTHPIVARVQGMIGAGEFARRIGDILHFEKTLCDADIVLLKYGFHLSEAQQKKHLRELEKDPNTRWRLTELQ